MIEQDFTIPNKLGMHARPAALMVRTTAEFESDVYISKDGQVVNGKSIMGVMTLAAEFGSVLTIQIEGEDEEDTLEAIEEIFERKFDED